MCWVAALMCPMACGAPDTHGSSERTVTVYDYVVGRGQFRLSPVEVAVADTGNAAADAVTALLEHRPPTGRDSAWSGYCAPGKSVRSVVMSDHLVTVNLGAYDTKAPVKLTVGGLVRIPSTAAGDTFVPAH